MGKRILYVWDADYPWDIRVEKICLSLSKYGHDVHIAARNLKRLPEYERVGRLHVHRLKSWSNGNINYVLSFPAFFSPLWNHFLHRLIKQISIELLIVRDLPMAPTAIWAGKRNGVPVILDMAENYVSMICEIWKANRFRGLNFFVRNPHLAKYVEKYSVRYADHVMVVVDEAIPIVINAGGSSEKVSVVANTPASRVFQSCSNNVNESLKLVRDRFSAIYVGGMQTGRGIETVLEAIPEIAEKIPNFLFLVVGDGEALQRFKDLVRNMHLEDYVLCTGWVNHDMVYDYIRQSDIGLIPHLVTNHTNTTLPNKLFDYMGSGVPVVATDAVPLRRILTEERCGRVYRSGDPRDLTKAIWQIHETELKYGENGKKAVIERYNWEKDEHRLLRVVDETMWKSHRKGRN